MAEHFSRQPAADQHRIVQTFNPCAGLVVHVYDLVGGRWRHMNTGAEIRHQKKAINHVTHPFKWYHKAWNAHHAAIHRLHDWG